MDGQFLVPGGHPPEPLQPPDPPLDQVPLAVARPVERPIPAGLRLLVRDHRLDTLGQEVLPDPLGRVPLVPGELLRQHPLLVQGLDQRDDPLGLVLLARAGLDHQGQDLATPDRRYQVQLGPEPALAAAQGVVGGFAVGGLFFDAPAADSWARTTDPSMANSSQSISPEAALRTWSSPRISSHSPSWDHRRNRSYTVFHFPNRCGRFRHRPPSDNAQRMPSITVRWSFHCFPRRPLAGRNSSIRSHWASDSSYRGESLASTRGREQGVPELEGQRGQPIHRTRLSGAAGTATTAPPGSAPGCTAGA